MSPAPSHTLPTLRHTEDITHKSDHEPSPTTITTVSAASLERLTAYASSTTTPKSTSQSLMPLRTPLTSRPEIPEINGSSAGFIALVVSLAAIVIICCTAVFFLLRGHNPTPYERELRRARRLQKRHTKSHDPYASPGLRGRIARLFGWKRAEGWVRADGEEGDAWDAGDERLVSKGEEDAVEIGTDRFAPLDVRGMPLPGRDMSLESVELSASEHDVGNVSYTDPFSSSPTSMEHSEAQRQGSGDTGRFSIRTGAKDSDATSIRSMRKFESGTKFKEALDF